MKLIAAKGKLLIEPRTSMTSLGNGLSINNETQNRKDIVSGKVLGEDKIVYFPLYAANTLSYEGTNYYILDERDILAYVGEDN